jgi:transposase
MFVTFSDASGVSTLIEQRACVKFCFKLGKTCTETFEMFQNVFGDETMRTYEWYRRFKDGRTSIEDDPRSGRPLTSTDGDSIVPVRAVIHSNRRLTVREMADECGISVGSCHTILMEKLYTHRVAAEVVPRLLADEQDFLTKTGATVIPQPPYSPDLAPADFFLFPKLKSTLKGRRFDTIEEIKENSLRQLKAIPKQAFQDSFETWKKRWGRCISSGGELVEGDRCS